MKKLFIFDFDGTLFDTVDDVVECFDNILKMLGFPALTKQEYIDCLGGNINQAVSLILGENNTPENVEIVKDAYEKCYDASKKDRTHPYEGILEVLEKFQENNMLLAVNSNRKTDSIKYFTDKFFKDIDFVLIEGHNVNYPSKPSPVGVNNIIRKANVELDEVLYIGDSQTDIKTAKNSKIDCVIVKWGYGNEKDWTDEYPIRVIEKVSDLHDLQL